MAAEIRMRSDPLDHEGEYVDDGGSVDFITAGGDRIRVKFNSDRTGVEVWNVAEGVSLSLAIQPRSGNVVVVTAV